jgi:hypothetical protein
MYSGDPTELYIGTVFGHSTKNYQINISADSLRFRNLDMSLE